MEWNRQSVYYLLKYASKQAWTGDLEGEWPNESHADLVTAAPDMLKALPDPAILRQLADDILNKDFNKRLTSAYLSGMADRVEQAMAKAKGVKG